MNLPDRRIETADLAINYLRMGAGPPLVLLHGWPEFCRVWKKNIPALSARFDVIAPDLRGLGDTRRRDGEPVEDTTPDILAADLAALLDALRIARAAIVSHDVGAFAAQAFARSWPERTSALFFFDCPYPGIGSRWGEAGHLRETWYQYFHQWPLAERLAGLSRDACRLYIGHFLRHWAADPHVFDDDLELWVDNFLKPGNLSGGFAWYRGTLPMRQKLIREGAPKLPPISCPTRVLWGARDPILRVEWMDRLPDYFSDLSATVVPDVGHFVHYEAPALANREMMDFLLPLAIGAEWTRR
jgi:pimeloyl-ACP methyl ester carboxylesterase